MQMQQSGTPINLSASGAISLCPGSMLGWHVNSTSGGTIVIRNGGSAGTALNAATASPQGWTTFPAAIPSASGAYATISGTIDVTFFFAAGG